MKDFETIDTKLHHFNLKSLIKLILMKALANIPKVLAQMEDLRKGQNIEYTFEEYKRNVKIFVQNVKNEVSSLIDSYEHIIEELRLQNQRLKESSPSKELTRTRPSVFSSPQNISPVPLRKNQQIGDFQLNKINTAKSKVFTSARDRSLQQLRLSPIFQKINLEQSHINPEANPFEKQPSKFQLKNKRKRHREEQLKYFLDCGNKNMKCTTEKFIQAFGGKNKRQIEQNGVSICQQYNKKQYSQDNESCMNKSLGIICNSLDTSYISKKAKSQKKQRKHQMQNEAQMKKRQDVINSEMLKKKGIKSLLERLRDNVNGSPNLKKSVLTTSKIFTHQKEEKIAANLSGLKKSSKVMINPVPIDIEKKSKMIRKENNTNPSPLKPNSILKQSTILTRSISGISAIQLDL